MAAFRSSRPNSRKQVVLFIKAIATETLMQILHKLHTTKSITLGDSYQIKDQHGLYFLTFQVVGWLDVFSRQSYRDIILDSLRYCRVHKSLEIFAFVVMTNHVHLIVRSRSGELSVTMRDLKRYTANNILKMIEESRTESRREWLDLVFRYYAKYNKRTKSKQFWTHENHAVELTSNEMIDSRLNYIHQNPVKAGWVENPEEYLYSSARNYQDMDSLLEIDMI